MALGILRSSSKASTKLWRKGASAAKAPAKAAKAAKAGQFVIVMEHEHGERIPLTLADFDPEQGTITLVIQTVGKTTR